jgi:cell division protein FtsL
VHRAINLGLMLATLGAAFALYAIKTDTRRLEARVYTQERALERAELDVSVLLAERAHLARPARIEPLARSLGLAPIMAGQYVRLGTRGAPIVPSPLVGEGQGGGDRRTSTAGIPPTPIPSPQGGGESSGPAVAADSQPTSGR